MDIQKPKRKILKWILLVIGVLILIYAIFFVYQVFTIRSQILAGTYDFERYSGEMSGQKGANISSRRYQVVTADDPDIGPEKPKVTIVEFADFQCPFSKKSYTAIRSLAEKYKDKVRFVYRDYPLDEIHPLARLTAQAGYCAHKEGRFWAFHDKLYQNQDKISPEYLSLIAAQVGLDENGFRACLDSKEAQSEVQRDWQEGRAAGVLGTPTWFIDGIRVAGVIPQDVLEKVIEGLLKE